MAKAPFAVAIAGGDKDSSTPVPVDPDSDSDKEHPLHEPQFVFHAVDDERRRRPALLPIHHRRPWAVADDEREERLRIYMIGPQAILCGMTLIFGALMAYVANSPEVRDHPDLDWNLLVTVSSALVMLSSLVSLLLSYLGVYYYDGWSCLN